MDNQPLQVEVPVQEKTTIPVKTRKGKSKMNCKVKADDIQNDVYHLYSMEKDKYLGIAYIPDEKNGIMNRLFTRLRIFNTSQNEQDKKSDFGIEMICHYHYENKQWVPICPMYPILPI